MSNFLRLKRKKCQGCGGVLPKEHATIEIKYAHNGEHRVSKMHICDSCEKVMEEIHELRMGTDRFGLVDED